MKLRTLALFCLGGAVFCLVLMAILGHRFWRDVNHDLRRIEQVSALYEEVRRLEVAIDYVTLLRRDKRILREITREADSIAGILNGIEHPSTRFGIAHLEDIAYIADVLAVEQPPDVAWPALTAQIRIHQSGLLDVLNDIITETQGRVLESLLKALALPLGAAIGLAGLVVLAFAVIYRRIGGPLTTIETGIRNITAGDLEARIVLRRDDELGELARTFNRMLEQRQAYERELAESEQRFRQLAENIDDVFWMIDPEAHRGIYVSPAYERVWGRPCEDLRRDSNLWLEAIHPTDRSRIAHALERQAEGGYHEEYRIIRPDGTIRWIFDRAFLVRDATGKVYRIAGVAQDITERKALEEQLRRSQRLESVGQLTGGVAHDFNNLLTVIQGNAELLAEELAGNRSLQPLAEMIGTAAQRGAELTHHLLAFARKQPLDPKVVDINRLLAGMDGLLRRTLGEHIEIDLVRGAGLWPALIDPSQLESALLNLCLNARDAMLRGGRLTIETHNTRIDSDYVERNPEVQPGEYVMVAVSDTGCGIPPEHLERVFEPFYTTKEKGKGTGLGLSMVYGFVKQSNGHIRLYSEPGQGTAVKLYLPQVTDTTDTSSGSDVGSALAGGDETILLVEDDDMVRRYAESQLKSLGYRVLTAVNGPAALDIVRHHLDIDLLFTDIVMPGGMSGRDLAEAARAIRPNLKVLYTSGYTENAIVHHGRLDSGVQLLGKPYRRVELTQKIRAALTDDTA